MKVAFDLTILQVHAGAIILLTILYMYQSYRFGKFKKETQVMLTYLTNLAAAMSDSLLGIEEKESKK